MEIEELPSWELVRMLDDPNVSEADAFRANLELCKRQDEEDEV